MHVGHSVGVHVGVCSEGQDLEMILGYRDAGEAVWCGDCEAGTGEHQCGLEQDRGGAHLV